MNTTTTNEAKVRAPTEQRATGITNEAARTNAGAAEELYGKGAKSGTR